MHQRFSVFLLVAVGMVTLPLWAQQPCRSFSVAVGTDEDQLMLAINGADNPQDQLAALDKFAAAHADSKFMPCVNEYYSTINLKVKDFDKSIEYGEKDLAANYQDLNLLLTLLRAYASSTKVSDTVFDVVNKVPDEAKAETGTPSRPEKATDADWDKIQKENQELAKDSHDLAVWAFFQVLPRVTDPAKQVQALDGFRQDLSRCREGQRGSGEHRLLSGVPDAGEAGQDRGVRRQGYCLRPQQCGGPEHHGHDLCHLPAQPFPR